MRRFADDSGVKYVTCSALANILTKLEPIRNHQYAVALGMVAQAASFVRSGDKQLARAARKLAGALVSGLAASASLSMDLPHVEGSPLHNIAQALLQKRHLLLAGPPGSGKTHLAKELAIQLTVVLGSDGIPVKLKPKIAKASEHPTPGESSWGLVQMHPSYSYADFVSGLRPKLGGSTGTEFEMAPGALLRMLAVATASPDANFVLVIDELNRANVPAVLGELFGLLGSSDRDAEPIAWRDAHALEKAKHPIFQRPDGSYSIPTTLPRNLYIIATMNTSDRSISSLDAALCRRMARFDIIPCATKKESEEGRALLEPYASPTSVLMRRRPHLKEICKLLDAVNAQLDPGDRIGHSHFLTCTSDADVRRAWHHNVVPYLADVCQGEETRWKKIEKLIKPHDLLKHREGDAQGFASEARELAAAIGLQSDDSESIAVLQTWHTLLEDKKALLLAGAPGCGKTLAAKKLARVVAGTQGSYECIAFHAEYSYEEFVQGLRPRAGDGGRFETVPGALLQAAERARQLPEGAKHVLVIDEFNRANLAECMGECYNLLQDRDVEVTLRSGEDESLPSNLYLIAMMNTADRSIASLDVALRRRFATVQFDLRAKPFGDFLPGVLGRARLPDATRQAVVRFFDAVHGKLLDGGGATPALLQPEQQIGISAFCDAAAACEHETSQSKRSMTFARELENKWRQELQPYVSIQALGDLRHKEEPIKQAFDKMLADIRLAPGDEDEDDDDDDKEEEEGEGGCSIVGEEEAMDEAEEEDDDDEVVVNGPRGYRRRGRGVIDDSDGADDDDE